MGHLCEFTRPDVESVDNYTQMFRKGGRVSYLRVFCILACDYLIVQKRDFLVPRVPGFSAAGCECTGTCPSEVHRCVCHAFLKQNK